MFDQLQIPYKKEEIRIPVKCEKIPMRKPDGEWICTPKEEAEIIIGLSDFKYDGLLCHECDHKSLRIGDFTNDTRSFIVVD